MGRLLPESTGAYTYYIIWKSCFFGPRLLAPSFPRTQHVVAHTEAVEMDLSKIPNITIEDLNQFHQAHFNSPTPSSSLLAQPQEDKQDDDLGYYSDGIKRTLTDDQIAMFRHSEIQRLLQQRRAAREEEAEAAEDVQAKGDSPIQVELDDQQQRSGAPKNPALDPVQKKSKFDYSKEPEERKKPRRRAREADDVKAEEVELDY